MKATLPAPVHEYLKALELELKQMSGVLPEEALSDAREFLLNEHDTLLDQRPDLGYQDLMEHFVDTYGAPRQIAAKYAATEKKSLEMPGFAPGWRLCCTTCGRSKPAERAGVVRIAPLAHKYVLGYCSNCRWIRWISVVKDLDQTNLTEQLGATTTAEQLRDDVHRPWLTVFGILLTVAAILAIVFGFQSLLKWALGF